MALDTLTIFLMITFPALVIFIIVMEFMRASGKAMVIDEFKNIKIKKCKIKDEKVVFTYNSASKAGIAVEDNVLKNGKNKFFMYQEINGTLLPCKIETLNDSVKLQLATSQEKLYETEALRAVANKIDETWWEKNKGLVMSAILLAFTTLVCIVMLNYAFDVTPITEPQAQLFSEAIESMRNQSQSNGQVIELLQQLVDQETQTTQGGDIPR